MIKNFRCRETQKIFHREWSNKIPGDIQRMAMRKLWMIHAAQELNDLKIPPGNRLEKLIKKRKGQYSIRINDQWRICFRWNKSDSYDVEMVDYH